MFKHISVLSLFAFCSFLLVACSKSNSGGGATTPGFCDGVTSKYSIDVQPIIAAGCLLGSNCHSTGSTNAGGELTDYNKVFNKRDAIKAAVSSGVMPQTGSLTTEQKKKIICWIDAGAANN
jgi:hypothetical protein